MDRTTDLETIRKHPRLFTWGYVETIYDLTEQYTIVQYTHVLNGKVRSTRFHIYVGGKDTSRGATSIEGAMITAIAYASFENKNESDHMGRAAAKLLDIDGV